MADQVTNEFQHDVFERAVPVVSTRKSQEQLLKIAKDRAYDPAIFDERAPIFFGAEFTSNRLDGYFTRMAPDTITNFVNGAREGVSFQDSHETRELGLGRTLYAEKEEVGDLVRGFADIFTLPGLPDLDEFIYRYRAGIAKDVSVGFSGGQFMCSICNQSIWDWRCPHCPGIEYDVEEVNAKGEVISKSRQLAFAWVRGATLNEISAVYKGATPGAAILKAQREAAGGRMTPDVASLLENRYRGLNLRDAHRRWAGTDFDLPVTTHLQPVTTHRLTDKGAEAMPNETPVTALSQPGLEPGAEAVTRATSATVLAPANDEHSRLITDLVTTAGLPAEVSGDFRMVSTHLRQMVADGKAFRATVIEEALLQGVRLMGDGFDKEGTRALFETANVESIRKMADQWKAGADKQIPAGRQSLDEAPVEPQEERTAPAPSLIPDAAFLG